MRIPERTPDVLRKIHSLTGAIPLGAFLIEHIAVNSTAIAGPESFRGAVTAIGRLPFLTAMEVLWIGLPLLAHMILGVFVATELPEEGNADAGGFATWSQRLTGVYLMIYVIFHIWGTRLSPDALKSGADLVAIMHKEIRHAGGFTFHALGVIAAAWHLGHGLPRFASRWGFIHGPAAARAAASVGWAVSASLAVAGLAALTAFLRAGGTS